MKLIYCIKCHTTVAFVVSGMAMKPSTKHVILYFSWDSDTSLGIISAINHQILTFLHYITQFPAETLSLG